MHCLAVRVGPLRVSLRCALAFQEEDGGGPRCLLCLAIGVRLLTHLLALRARSPGRRWEGGR